jgi:anti-anti-sigma factor
MTSLGACLRTFVPGNMLLEITHRKREGIAILDLNGSLTFGQEDLEFRNELDRMITAGDTCVLLNLSGLRKLDSAGAGTLLFTQASVRKAGGNLAILLTRPSRAAAVSKHIWRPYSRYFMASRMRSTASSPVAQSGVTTYWNSRNPVCTASTADYALCRSDVPADYRIGFLRRNRLSFALASPRTSTLRSTESGGG